VKRCKSCGVEKPFDAFYRNATGRDGRRPECKTCTSNARKSWYRANRARVIAHASAWQRANAERYSQRQREYREAGRRDYRAEHLRWAFGITQADYVDMLDAQRGGCAICGARPVDGGHLHVDHDHSTGRIRGLLCFRCNNALGLLKDDRSRLQRAAEYVDPGEPSHVVSVELDDLARRRVRELVGTVPV
jgi:hypothetical protein